MGCPSSRAGRVSFPALPCLLGATSLSPSPYSHPPSTFLLAQAGDCLGILDLIQMGMIGCL